MLIQTNQDKLFFASIFITLNAENLQERSYPDGFDIRIFSVKALEELNEKTKILESELGKKTAMIRVLTFRQLEGLKTMLPIRRNTDF